MAKEGLDEVVCRKLGLITYQPDLDQAEIDKLTELVGSRSYVLLSPYEGLAGSHPVVHRHQ